MMEGIASEAASLAAHLGLDNLCWVYDNNHITIEGNTRITFTEDVATRFLGYGWNVLRVGDANDTDRIDMPSRSSSRRRAGPPSSFSTAISATVHRTSRIPPKRTVSRSARRRSVLPSAATDGPNEKFLVPDGVYEHFAAGVGARGAKARKEWTKLFSAYRGTYPDLAAQIEQMQRRELPAGRDDNLPVFPADSKGMAGREASGKVLNVLAQNIPWFLGGSADLGPSNKTLLTFEGAGDFQADTPGGKNLHYGIREHAMGSDREWALPLQAPGVRRDILYLQRLPAPRHSAISADGTAYHFRVHSWSRWATERQWPDSPAGTNTWHRCAPFRGWLRCGPLMPTKSSRPIAASCTCATSLSYWRCRASPCRPLTEAGTHRHRVWRTALTCWRTPPTATPK